VSPPGTFWRDCLAHAWLDEVVAAAVGSVDQNVIHVVSSAMYASQLMAFVSDVDACDHFLLWAPILLSEHGVEWRRDRVLIESNMAALKDLRPPRVGVSPSRPACLMDRTELDPLGRHNKSLVAV
jgi:hypothetical protein